MLDLSLAIDYPQGCVSIDCRDKFDDKIEDVFDDVYPKLQLPITFTNNEILNVQINFCSITKTLKGKAFAHINLRLSGEVL
jgi:hypothetical protein